METSQGARPLICCWLLEPRRRVRNPPHACEPSSGRAGIRRQVAGAVASDATHEHVATGLSSGPRRPVSIPHRCSPHLPSLSFPLVSRGLVFTGLYGLTASQTALLVAVPVLLGSLARLPMGMLTDRFGGRLVFTALLAFSSLAAFVVPLTGSYGSLLVAAFLIGMAGSSFAVGAAFVSRWTPAARQGTALGVYGLGTMGQSLAVFVGPVVAARLGWEAVFRGTSALLAGLGGRLLPAGAESAAGRAVPPRSPR